MAEKDFVWCMSITMYSEDGVMTDFSLFHKKETAILHRDEEIRNILWNYDLDKENVTTKETKRGSVTDIYDDIGILYSYRIYQKRIK